MVKAQEYIENNFSKNVIEISTAGGKDLEGHLDLSEYLNLNKLELGFNPRLISLKLPTSSKITWISLYNTGIDDFSFLANLPNMQNICLPRTGDIIGESSGNTYIAKTIRDICRVKIDQLKEKDQQVKNLENQLTQKDSLIADLQTQLEELKINQKQQEQLQNENNHLKSQLNKTEEIVNQQEQTTQIIQQ